MTYEELLQTLFRNQDLTYRDFHKKLLKNESICVIGVRTPVLRKIAKEWKGNEDGLLAFPNEYYEVVFLKCAVVSALPFAEFCRRVDGIVFLLDNWAACDLFQARCIRAHREEFLPYVKKYLADDGEFVQRYALVTLLQFYLDEEYLPLIFESAAGCGEKYYIQTAAAWLVAEVLVKFYPQGTAFLKENKLSAAVQNRAVQKARESFRLSFEQKQELSGLRRLR